MNTFTIKDAMTVVVALIKRLLLSILVLAASTAQAYAYLDPGTGSMILQAIATAGIGAMLYFAWFWRKIKNFFRGDSAPNDADLENEEANKD